MFKWFFGIDSENHRQVYEAWRAYPLAIKHALIVGFLVGEAFMVLVWLLVRGGS